MKFFWDELFFQKGLYKKTMQINSLIISSGCPQVRCVKKSQDQNISSTDSSYLVLISNYYTKQPVCQNIFSLNADLEIFSIQREEIRPNLNVFYRVIVFVVVVN